MIVGRSVPRLTPHESGTHGRLERVPQETLRLPSIVRSRRSPLLVSTLERPPFRYAGTSVDMLGRDYSFAIEDLEDEGPKPAVEERIRARQLALAGRRRGLRVA